MAGPMGMEYELNLQKEPGAWNHVLTTKAWEAVVEGPGGRRFGLAIPLAIPSELQAGQIGEKQVYLAQIWAPPWLCSLLQGLVGNTGITVPSIHG